MCFWSKMYNGVGGGEGVHHVADGAQLVRLAALHARAEKMKFAGHVEYKRAVSGRRENWVKSWDQQCEAKHAVRVGGGERGARGLPWCVTTGL